MTRKKFIIQRSINVKTGSEGPKHDPYGYREIIWTENGEITIFHSGLGSYLKTSDGEIIHESMKVSYKELRTSFKEITGIEPEEVISIYEELNACPTHCPKCKSRISYCSGYVGECIAYCPNDKCDAGIVWNEEVTDAMIM